MADTNPLSGHTSAVKRKSVMSPNEVTERLNEVCAQIDDDLDGDRAFLAAAARRLLKNVEWDSSPDDSCPTTDKVEGS
jgi:hypothetical protein